jgi:probable O-glycosylation ligase (exosortase A-associated)
MLRDIILSLAVLACLGMTARYPFAGVLTWAWVAIMQPQREAYGIISSTLRINLLIGVVTILAWFFSRERKLPAVDGTLVAIALFLAWMTFNCFFSPMPAVSWPLWDNTWKLLALGLLVGALANNKNRIHALMWVIALCFLYYGVKGGVLTVLTGGGKKITGPFNTLIGDNNQLALSLLMILPLINYLREHSANRMVRLALLFGGGMTFLSVIGSYSRGAYLSLAALAILGWLRAKNKLIYPIAIAVVGVPALMFMPQAFWNRLGTLNSLNTDDSFQGRLTAWKVAYYYARDHFPFGAGFAVPQQDPVFHFYFPEQASHAAHSIYFQVLGEHGFIGLGLFLMILVLALKNTLVIRRATRGRPELRWIRDLATAIQLGLLAYCVGGSALSMAYDDTVVIWCMALPLLRNLAMQPKYQRSSAVVTGAPAFARPLPSTPTAPNEI